MITMEAGRELDVLVAVHVMSIEIPKWLDIPEGLRTRTSREIVPDYSTDIAAAWLVVEKLRLAVEPQANGMWGAGQPRVIGEGETETDLTIRHTAPHAICIAALTVVGVEIPT